MNNIADRSGKRIFLETVLIPYSVLRLIAFLDFYVIILSEKNILSGRRTGLADYVHYFFLLGCYPVGLFHIQKDLGQSTAEPD